MQQYIKKLLYICFLALMLVHPASAMETFVIEDIRVEGLNRISAGTVFNYLPVALGDDFDERRSAEAVRALYKTGLFSDVRLKQEGNVLVVIVSEREAISKITINGNKALKTDKLLEGLKQVGFAEGEVFNPSLLDKVQQELRRQYFSLGKYAVKIDTEVKDVDSNRVEVTLDISEGKTARIKEINIIGNHTFPEKKLRQNFNLTTGTLFSAFTKSDQYSKQKLGADLETLRSYYLDRGYVNFNIDSTQVSLTPNKQDVYITINVAEGDKFTVSDVKLSGELIVSPEVLYPEVETLRGAVFSRKDVTQTSKNITDKLGDEGYAFANVNSIPDINNENHTVALTYFVDPGKRVYVRRLNFSGNTKTRDEVLRQEMRQIEGSWISTSDVERSKIRLQKTGYFEEINVETPAVPGTSDQVDVNFAVVEKQSGKLSLGLGFSQTQGLIFNTDVTQDNFLGSGKRINFAFSNSDVNRRYALGYTNPYWSIDGISRGFQAFYRETDTSQANVTAFDSTVWGGGINFGIPITEYQFVRTSLDYENTDISEQSESSQALRDFIDENGNKFDSLNLRASIAYDSRNKAILPNKGTYHSLRSNVAIPPAELRFYRLDYSARWFYSLSETYTMLLKGDVGWGDGYSGSALPFFDNFYAGGPRSVRGYEENTLGPQDEFGRATGGNLKFTGGAEVILPVPFLSDVKSIRLTGFFDAGNVWNTRSQDPEFTDIRMSAGLAGLWISPFGIISVSAAVPFNEQSGDKTQPFQFTFGTSF